jgi:hypothetical protein
MGKKYCSGSLAFLSIRPYSLTPAHNSELSFVADSFAAAVGFFTPTFALKYVLSYNPDQYIITLIKTLHLKDIIN